MRLVVARCTVVYAGRLDARLDEAVRLLMVKADGSVLVHADGGSYKPLNWMSPPCVLVERENLWEVTNKAGEKLEITLHEVIHDYVAVEIKRRGEIDGVEQLTRYLDLMNRDPAIAPVRGIFAAQEIKPQAKTLASDRGIECKVFDYDALREIDDGKLRLF